MRLIDADELIELIDDDISSLDKNMSREGYDACLCTLQMVKQYIKALPTVPLDWKSIMDDWTEHDNAMIAKGREIERRLNAPKHGRWIVNNETKEWVTIYCDQCHDGMWNRKGDPYPNYCFNCGADMREVEE